MQWDFAGTLINIIKDQALSRGYPHGKIAMQRSQPKRLTHSSSSWVAGKRQQRRLNRVANR